VSEAAEGPGWKLILGDCLDPANGLASLADESVDHVICDPPYCDETHERRNVTEHRNGYEVAAIDFAPLDLATVPALASEFLRVARRWVVVFTSDRNLGPWIAAFGDAFVRSMVWVKTDPMPQMTGDRPAHGFELLVLAHRAGRKRWNGGGRPGTYATSRGDGKRDHPTQKPIGLMESLVRDFSDADDVVCDPFTGSGTTGVACGKLGRQFLGWEVNAQYHAVAKRRLMAAREQLRMFEGSG
jgi:site-specific DNA-methyltransferase (adenine-specific)